MTLISAYGYLRTSSVTNVGEDKDSDKRQMAAIDSAARSMGYCIREWFYDAGVKGSTPVNERPAFMRMVDALASNGVRHVIIEDIGRFSRVATVGMLGIALLRRLDVTMIDARGTDCTDPQDAMAKAMLGIMLVFAELEKDLLVKKLAGARQRKSDALGRRVEGRKGYTRGNLNLVARAKALAANNTLLGTSAALADQGYLTARGKPFSATQIKRLVLAG